MREKVTRVTRPCPGCGLAVIRTPAYFADADRRERQTYCSRSCASRAVNIGRAKPASRTTMLRVNRLGLEAFRANAGARRVTQPCEQCGAAMSVKPCLVGRKRFCSADCKHAKRRTVTGPEHWLFTREPRACEMCGTTALVKRSLVSRFRFCSRRCAGSWVSNTWPRTSSIERALHESLWLRGVPFEIEHAIGPWTVDIAFPIARLVVEADGTYWHGRDKQKATDRRKDAYMRSHGWRVLRFTEVAITASPDACVDEIMRWLPPS